MAPASNISLMCAASPHLAEGYPSEAFFEGFEVSYFYFMFMELVQPSLFGSRAKML